MAGIQLSALVDTFLGTSQAVLTGENFILNERQRNNYLLYMIMKNYDMEEMLHGGDTITDQIILDEDGTYGPYNVLEQKTPRLSNHLTEFTMQWALTDAHVTFSKHEKGLNQASNLKKGARAMVFKKIIKAKWSNLLVNVNNGMEKEFYAQPNASTMETVTSGTRVPYSIFCTITEHGALSTDNQPFGTTPGGFGNTIQGIDQSANPRWRNPVEFYADGETEINTASGNWDGFQAFSVMYDRLRFDQLAIRPEYGETEEPEGFIQCSRKGKSLVEFAQRGLNDHTRHGKSDAAYPGLNYNGIPIRWVESMDKAVVWDDGSSGFAGENDNTLDEAGVSGGTPTNEGPRYVWLIPKYFKKYIHSEHFMEQETPPASVYQPYQRTVFFDCWHQNGTRSRLRGGGVISPSVAEIDGFIG